MTGGAALRLIDECASQVAGDDEVINDWTVNYARHHRYRLSDDLALIARTVDPSQRILEFGSSPPIMTLALKRSGYDVVGLDLAPERFARTIAAHGLDVRRVNFETEPVPVDKASFDAVLFNEVFEHLRIDLIGTLRGVRRVMRVGGTLMLSTPNMRSVRGLWTLLTRRTTCHIGSDLFGEWDKIRRFGHMGHVREYTAAEVARFLEQVGFEIRRVEYRDYGPPVRKSLSVRLQSVMEKTACVLMPSLRPLFSIIATKTDDDRA